jgi:hypothetical protein
MQEGTALMDLAFDSTPRRQITRVLDPGESLIWSGIPRQGLLLRPTDALMIPFSLLWGGFAFYWEASALSSGAPPFFLLWGIPFVLVGVYIIVGRFFVDARVRANTFYGLTDRRVIILSGLFARTTSSLPLRNLTDISLQERSDRSGSILLGRPHPQYAWFAGTRWPGTAQYATPCLELIPTVKRVYDQLLEAQRAAK